MKTLLAVSALALLASCEGGRSYPPAAYYPVPPITPACMMPERISTYEYSKLTGSFNNPTLARHGRTF